MLKISKITFFFFVFFASSSILLAQSGPGELNESVQTDIKKYGLEVVFVVDVSPSLDNHRKLTQKFIEQALSMFKTIDTKANHHLITFCEDAKWHKDVSKEFFCETITTEIAKIIKITQNKKKSRKVSEKERREIQKSFPKNGLREVFSIISEHFPQKIGVILFISDGEDSLTDREPFKKEERALQEDVKQSIRALKNSGFTIFSTFINTENNSFICRACMQEIARISGTELLDINVTTKMKDIINKIEAKTRNLNYSSPLPRKEFREFELQKNAIIEKKENELRIAQPKLEELKEWKSNLNLLKEKNQSLNKKFENIKKENMGMKSDLHFLSIWQKASIFVFFIFLSALVSISRKPDNFKATLSKVPIVRDIVLKKMWGKLVLQSNPEAACELENKLDGNSCKISESLPELSFDIGCSNGGKYIRVSSAEGRTDCMKGNADCCDNNYIDETTKFIRISQKNDSETIEENVNYLFLQELAESLNTPVHTEEKFKGYEHLIGLIKYNFEIDIDDRKHILIVGKKKCGKTSLIKFLKGDWCDHLSERIILEFNEIKDMNRYNFENHIKGKIVFKEKKEIKILLIDDYDLIFERFKDGFANLLTDIQGEKKFYIVATVLRSYKPDKYLPHFPTNTTKIVLDNLEKFETKLKTKEENQRRLAIRVNSFLHKLGFNRWKNSLVLIDSVIKDVGFPDKYIRGRTKKLIAKYAGGHPYLIKLIMYKIFQEWFSDTNFFLKKADVKDIISKIADKDISIENLYDFTEIETDEELKIVNQILQLSSIIQKFHVWGKSGRLKKKLLKEELLKEHMAAMIEAGIDEKQMGSYLEIMLRYLQTIGFIINHRNSWEATPLLFFDDELRSCPPGLIAP